MRRRRGTRYRQRVRVWPWLSVLPVLLMLAWISGFGWFLHRILRPTPAPGYAQGMVVLTGGAGRIRRAFHLLIEGHASRLLVSGVAPGTSLAEIAGLARVPEAMLRGRVDLGRRARSTSGNARETKRWAAAWHVRSLIVVTSFYHMPRALDDFRAMLPDVRLIPADVSPRRPVVVWPFGLWRVVAAEYCKWLATEAGLTPIVAWVERRRA